MKKIIRNNLSEIKNGIIVLVFGTIIVYGGWFIIKASFNEGVRILKEESNKKCSRDSSNKDFLWLEVKNNSNKLDTVLQKVLKLENKLDTHVRIQEKDQQNCRLIIENNEKDKAEIKMFIEEVNPKAKIFWNKNKSYSLKTNNNDTI